MACTDVPDPAANNVTNMEHISNLSILVSVYFFKAST